MIEFTEDEVSWLVAIVVDSINEGCMLPPYPDTVYNILEKLGINNDIPFHLQYDVERPNSEFNKNNEDDSDV